VLLTAASGAQSGNHTYHDGSTKRAYDPHRDGASERADHPHHHGSTDRAECLCGQERWTTLKTPPTFAAVKVAIVDSGIDGTLPDFAGRIADARSFVGGSRSATSSPHSATTTRQPSSRR
jgi:subtilisin family serine protease